MAEPDVRIEIGFDGGLILGMKLALDEWSKLEAAVNAGEGVVAVVGEDMTYHVDVSKISYVKHEARFGKVGF
ncbi:MAG: hypothetical protein ACXVYV_02040 [Gaiellales bacterium]